MILLSPDAVEDVERLRLFLDQFRQRSPDERSDIRGRSRPAYRSAHAGYGCE
ncbi:hypothetical protein [Bradyrhizobium sp. 5.13L]